MIRFTKSERKGILVVAAVSLAVCGAGIAVTRCGESSLPPLPEVDTLRIAPEDSVGSPGATDFPEVKEFRGKRDSLPTRRTGKGKQVKKHGGKRTPRDILGEGVPTE